MANGGGGWWGDSRHVLLIAMLPVLDTLQTLFHLSPKHDCVLIMSIFRTEDWDSERMGDAQMTPEWEPLNSGSLAWHCHDNGLKCQTLPRLKHNVAAFNGGELLKTKMQPKHRMAPSQGPGVCAVGSLNRVITEDVVFMTHEKGTGRIYAFTFVSCYVSGNTAEIVEKRGSSTALLRVHLDAGRSL